MKNLITLALMIGFSAFTFTACGDKDNDSGDTGAEEVQEEGTEEGEGGEAGEGGDTGEAGDTGEGGDTGEAGSGEEAEADAGTDAEDAAISYLEFAPIYVTVLPKTLSVKL